jgi:hypothetical protein
VVVSESTFVEFSFLYTTRSSRLNIQTVRTGGLPNPAGLVGRCLYQAPPQQCDIITLLLPLPCVAHAPEKWTCPDKAVSAFV